ncbi:putative membrane protein [Bacteroides fragilis str. 1009-4-F |nr:putative membrane protein [Bacteroides fragilis str. 3-F-2 \
MSNLISLVISIILLIYYINNSSCFFTEFENINISFNFIA